MIFVNYRRFFVVLFYFLIIAIFYLLQTFTPAYAQIDCLKISQKSSQSEKDYCRNELNEIEKELADLQAKQEQQRKQTGTIKGDISYLNSQITALQTKIKARSLAIAQLKVSINEKNNKIESLQEKIEREHESLAGLIRKYHKSNDISLIEIVLSDGTISDFFLNLDSYDAIQEAIKKSVDTIKEVKNETESEKKDLENKQDQETDAKAELETSKSQVTQSQNQKKQLLAISQQKESEYQKLAAEKKAKAEKIRGALFNLAGTSQKIEFGTALQYANEAKSKTGVDPAFLLAVITQESNLGQNVGQCYLTNKETGAGVGKNTGTPFNRVMKPMGLSGRKGDVNDFLRITEKFGLKWNETAISCPIASDGGWGGAMGPAQFIPTTWTIFEERLEKMLGYTANPWQPRDAFIASALYLTELGAIGNSYSAQMRAACKYYGTGGSSCSYGRSVMKIKEGIQNNINYLNDNL